MSDRRTQVAIIGAGPAGLMLGHLLHLRGIDSVILEARSRDYVVERVRAGVLEQGTVDLMCAAGVGDRLQREGIRHRGIYIAFGRRRHHLDMAGLTGGRAITIYGQNEVVKDLIDVRLRASRPLCFEVEQVMPADLDGRAPVVSFRQNGEPQELVCDFVAGCDGFHGVCRTVVAPSRLRVYEREYPFGWLGILAHAPPSSDELVYSNHPRGFALFSMRSAQVTRLYLQCAPDESADDWPDDRIWSELRSRLETDDGWRPNEGEIVQKAVTGMRSFVLEPMRAGRLFLAGDAAHIVPPTGAKGLNLAMADVSRLAAALGAFYTNGSEGLLDEYSDVGLRRTWRAQRFSWWMTSTLHRMPGESEFDRKRQLAELDYLFSSQAAMTSLAENYVGAPFEH
jgi:p-hydroxybenzoate 3-monooxygenase